MMKNPFKSILSVSQVKFYNAFLLLDIQSMLSVLRAELVIGDELVRYRGPLGVRGKVRRFYRTCLISRGLANYENRVLVLLAIYIR